MTSPANFSVVLVCFGPSFLWWGPTLSALICFLHLASFGEGPSRAGQYVVTPNNGGSRLLPPAKQAEPTRVDVNRVIVRIKLAGHPSLTNSLFWPLKTSGTIQEGRGDDDSPVVKVLCPRQ